MKHFLVEITYTIPVEQLGGIVAEHRAFLQAGYDSGMLLMSGPQNPKLGGIVVARAASQEEVEIFFRDDPYFLRQVGIHRFLEFDPVKRQGFIEDWVNGR